MITFDFNQTGGYPLTTETLARMQDAYGSIEGVARMAGNFAIISGCDETSTTVGDGLVMINGELLEFRAGIKQSTVFIGTETKSDVFENGEAKIIETVRYCSPGVGSEQFPWANFKRVQPLNDIEGRLAKMEKLMTPLLDGGILLWNKPANLIPPGWAEVTDLRGRMPVGWNPDDGDFNQIGKIGGAKTHTLSIAEMPSHRHSTFPFNKYTARAIDVNERYGNMARTGGSFDNITPEAEIASGAHTNKTWQDSTEQKVGGGLPHNNMSPYRTVMFIKYVG